MFAYFGGLSDILAPRPEPRNDFNLLLRSGQISEALALLKSENQLWIDEPDRKGLCPIHIAAGMGAVEIVLELLSQGANINATSTSGSTAIHYAALNGHKGIVDLLLRSGGDPSVPNNAGEVAAEICDDSTIQALLLRDHSVLSPGSRDRWHQNQYQEVEPKTKRNPPLSSPSFAPREMQLTASVETASRNPALSQQAANIDDISDKCSLERQEPNSDLRNPDSNIQPILLGTFRINGDEYNSQVPAVLSLSELRRTTDIARMRVEDRKEDEVFRSVADVSTDATKGAEYQSMIPASLVVPGSGIYGRPNPSPVQNPIIDPISSVARGSAGLMSVPDHMRESLLQVVGETNRAALVSAECGPETAARQLLMLACISPSFNEELIASVLQDWPFLSNGRVVESQMSRIHEFSKSWTNMTGASASDSAYLLRKYPESLNSLTYMHLAAGCGNAAMVAMLLDASATAWCVDSFGRTPLHVACAWGGYFANTFVPSVTDVTIATISSSNGAILGDDEFDETDMQAQTNVFVSRIEEVCELLLMAMNSERGINPVGDAAPVDCLGRTPAGSYNAFNVLQNTTNLRDIMKSRIGIFPGNPVFLSYKSIPCNSISRPVVDEAASSGAAVWVPSVALQDLLLCRGDKSILPYPPGLYRSGKSPWRFPGGDRENVIFAFAEANLWSKQQSEYIIASCPLPGRPAWNCFSIVSGMINGSTCAALVADHLPRIFVNEADRAARYFGSALKQGGLIGDNDTTPSILCDVLHRVCQQVDKAVYRSEYMKISTIPVDSQTYRRLLDPSKYKRRSITSGSNLYSQLEIDHLQKFSKPLEKEQTHGIHSSQVGSVVNGALSHSSAVACMCLISADYIAICNVGEMTVVLAQRPPSEPRGSFTTGSAVLSPFIQVTSTTHTIDFDKDTMLPLQALPPIAKVTRRQSKSNLVATVLSPPREVQSEEGAIFGAFLEKASCGIKIHQRKHSETDGVCDNSPDTSDEYSTVETNVAVYNRSSRDAFCVLGSRSLWAHMLAQEVVDFVAAKLGFSDYGGPVGGVSAGICIEACDGIVEECRSRGCVENVAVIVVILGAPPDPYRRGSPTADSSNMVITSSQKVVTPRGESASASSSIPSVSNSSAQQQRRNSRRMTPSSSSLQQSISAALSGNEIKAPGRRNTPGAVTMQAYIEAARLGNCASILEDDTALNLPCISESADLKTSEAADVHIMGGELHQSVAMVVSPQASTQDDTDYLAVHSSTSESSASLSSEMYSYNGNRTAALSPLGNPTTSSMAHSGESSVGVSTPMDPRNFNNRSRASGGALSYPSLSSPAAALHLYSGPQSPVVGVPVSLTTTPESSLRSIFAMVPEGDDEMSSPYDPASARESVRKQLGFNDA